MEEILVRKLNLEGMSLSCVSNSDLIGYLQTKDTINRIENYLVKPFENSLSELDEGFCDVFSSSGIYLGAQNSDVPVLRESCDVISKFEEVISDSLVQNKFGKRLDGVKRYSGTTTFDALNLHNLVKHFKSEKMNLERVLDVNIECSSLESVMEVYSPRLVFLDSEFNCDVSNLCENDVGFYIAGKNNISNLKTKIIKPFENLFLDEFSTNSNSNDVYRFGDLGVVVNMELSQVCDYDTCLNVLQNNLLNISRMNQNSSNGSSLFFNNELIIPRMYVSKECLNSTIECEKSKKMEILDRTLSIEYMPKFTHII